MDTNEFQLARTKEKMSIYVVMRDEDICGIFTHTETATRMAEAIGGRWSKYELNPQLPDEAVAGYNFYSVHMLQDGGLVGAWKLIECIDYRDHKPGHSFYGHENPQWQVLKVNVWAKTPQDAREHANRIREELIATGRW